MIPDKNLPDKQKQKRIYLRQVWLNVNMKQQV